MKTAYNTLKANIILTIIFTLMFCLSLANCYIIIPLNIYPEYKINETTPSLIMRNIVYNQIYANLEIGTPKESIQIPLEFESNDFYIAGNAKNLFLKVPNRWDEINFYNINNSKTCEKVEEKEYDGDNFVSSKYYKDIFYFNETQVELEFYLPTNLNRVESGGIGLELWPLYEITTSTIDDKRTFLKKLKDNNLINNFYWSIFYNSKNFSDNKGFILLGPLPHILNQDLGYYNKEYFDPNYLYHTPADIWFDVIKYRFKFDEIFAYRGNNKSDKISYNDLPFNESTRLLNVELYYNSGGIQASNRFLPYFKNYFKEYISKGECFLDTFMNNKKNFFYCKNDKNLIIKIKKNFPSFNFLNRQLNINFELIPDDLFMEHQNYVYLLLFFHYTTGDDWIMGRPFLQKYQFIINPDSKDISFYSCIDKINNTNSNSNSNINPKTNNIDNKINTEVIIFIIIIIVAVIIIIVLGFFLWKFYLEARYSRKKRANELSDDYEYSNADKIDLNSEENKENINNPINE